jgi:hypothetical protein
MVWFCLDVYGPPAPDSSFVGQAASPTIFLQEQLKDIIILSGCADTKLCEVFTFHVQLHCFSV